MNECHSVSFSFTHDHIARMCETTELAELVDNPDGKRMKQKNKQKHEY